MTKGTRDPKSPKIGFHNWNLDTINEQAPELFNAAFKEALDIATEEYECDVTLAVTDHLQLRVGLPLGAEQYDDPTWIVSLDDVISDIVLLEDSEEYITKVRDELRRLTERLNARLARK